MGTGEAILVVDDDGAHRYMLVRVLGSWGYETYEAADGLAALEMVRRNDFDLVLMDVRMRALSGLEALERIKASKFWVPVILMSAYWPGEAIVQARKAGASEVLSKPLSLGPLRDTIRLNLARRSQKGPERVRSKIVVNN